MTDEASDFQYEIQTVISYQSFSGWMTLQIHPIFEIPKVANSSSWLGLYSIAK
jgi:hypothetical protein